MPTLELDSRMRASLYSIISEAPEMDRDDQIRAALNKTETSIDDYDCLYKLHDSALQARSLEDYAANIGDAYELYDALPISVKIFLAVDDSIKELRAANPDLPEQDLLYMAYDIARRELTNDYIVDDQGTATGVAATAVTRGPGRPRKPGRVGRPAKSRAGKLTTAEVSTEATGGAFLFPGMEFGGTEPEPEQATFFAATDKVTSTNVAEVGYDNGQLLVYFQNGSGYAYDVDPGFYAAMMKAQHKGKFVWDELRGRTPGHVIDAPSRMTPGGVGGSLVNYDKIKGARLHRKRIEAILEKYRREEVVNTTIGDKDEPGEKAVREGTAIPEAAEPVIRGPGRPKKGAGKRGRRPKSRAGKNLTQMSEAFRRVWEQLTKQRQAEEVAQKEAAKQQKRQEKIRKDAIKAKIRQLRAALKITGLPEIAKDALKQQIDNLKRQMRSDYLDYINDFYTDDTIVLGGRLTRGGAFEYHDSEGGVRVPGYDVPVKFKDYNQLKDVITKYQHFPAFDTHDETRFVGFAYDLVPNDENESITGKVIPFKDLDELSDLPPEEWHDFPVSLRLLDNSSRSDLYQDISDILHVAVSFNKTDRDRCSTVGGLPCSISIIQSPALPTITSDFVDSNMVNKKETDDDSEIYQGEDKEKGGDKKKDDKGRFPDDPERKGAETKNDFSETTTDTDTMSISIQDYENLLQVAEDHEKLKGDFATLQSEKKTMLTEFNEIKDWFNTKKAEEAAQREKDRAALVKKLSDDNRVKADFLDTIKDDYDKLKFLAEALPDRKEAKRGTMTKTIPGMEHITESIDDFKTKYTPEKLNKWGTSKPQGGQI